MNNNYVHLRNSFLKVTFYIIFFVPFLLNAQVVYEPVTNDVYQYLDRMKTKGVIEFDNLILPLSREYIAEKLFDIDSTKNRISSLEKKELLFYLKEYGYELKIIRKNKINDKTNKQSTDSLKANKPNIFEYEEYKNIYQNKSHSVFFKKDEFYRFRLFKYNNSKFSIFIDPILGVEFTNWDKNNSTHTWNGINLYGYIGENFGFSLDFRDNTESGNLQDSLNLFTPEQGLRKNGRGSFQYNIVNAQISYRWSNGSISVGKTPFEWGFAENGKIVHSSKAPSYPNLRLDLKLTDWMTLNYLFGVLNSEVIDSNEVYNTLRENVVTNRETFREKYLASHSISLKPFKGFKISLGESIIISDKFEPAYLIPILFFRATDHYLSSQNNNAGNNSQFFFNISSVNHIPNTHLYATLFIDEIITGEILNKDKSKNQLGYTIGSSIVDFPVANSNLKIEYSHLNPFVYRHYIPAQFYQNQGYDLGHWIGHNADIFHVSYSQRVERGLEAKIWTQFIRKGEDGTADMMYKTPQPEFLFGLNTNYTYYGLDLKYEIIHDLNIRTKYQYSSVETEYEKGKFNKEKFNSFKFAIYYGM